MMLAAAVLLAAAVDAQVAVGPVIGLAGWALDDPDHHNKVRPSANGSTLRVTSDTRVFLVKDSRKTLWADHEYLKIDLRSGPLRFTLDLSGVPCGCLACVYLVAMQDPSRTSPNYCDIYGSTGGKVCLEADILEANNVAFSTNLHTRAGVGHDGTCNAWGCLTTLGPTASPQERKAYGPGRGFKVDTRHPFDVEVNMDDQGGLSVNLLQGSSRVVAFDPHKAGNPQGRGLPPDALRAFREAMGRLTLVASLWSTGTANEWLEGKCMECVLGQATYTLSDLRLGNLGQFRNIPPGLPPRSPLPLSPPRSPLPLSPPLSPPLPSPPSPPLPSPSPSPSPHPAQVPPSSSPPPPSSPPAPCSPSPQSPPSPLAPHKAPHLLLLGFILPRSEPSAPALGVLLGTSLLVLGCGLSLRGRRALRVDQPQERAWITSDNDKRPREQRRRRERTSLSVRSSRESRELRAPCSTSSFASNDTTRVYQHEPNAELRFVLDDGDDDVDEYDI